VDDKFDVITKLFSMETMKDAATGEGFYERLLTTLERH
jgi:hypothetical protein